MRRRDRHRRSRLHGHVRRHADGFTLVELAITVSIIGVLSLVVSSAYFSIAEVRARALAQGQAEVARQAIRAFLLKNKRLPCPDRSAGGNGGREGLAGTCPAGQVGWLPYESLGLALPVPSVRMRYAVSRTAAADLVEPAGGTSGGFDFDGNGRIRNTLVATAKLSPSSARPFLTGVGTPSDAESCAHVVSNPAFALIAPVSDRDASGGAHAGFDGINQQMATADSTCIAAPGRAMDASYDDVVVAESASALLGWLAAHTR
ncbi:MAG: type II secretion system protein [Lysobacter sp.]